MNVLLIFHFHFVIDGVLSLHLHLHSFDGLVYQCMLFPDHLYVCICCIYRTYVCSSKLMGNSVGKKKQTLEKARKNDPATDQVDLHNEELDDGDAKELRKALRTNTVVIELMLGDNKIGDVGAFEIAQLLKENQTIQEVFLNDNRITTEGALTLVETLRNYNRTVLEINLNGNHRVPNEIFSEIRHLCTRNAREQGLLGETPTEMKTYQEDKSSEDGTNDEDKTSSTYGPPVATGGANVGASETIWV